MSFIRINYKDMFYASKTDTTEKKMRNMNFKSALKYNDHMAKDSRVLRIISNRLYALKALDAVYLPVSNSSSIMRCYRAFVYFFFFTHTKSAF